MSTPMLDTIPTDGNELYTSEQYLKLTSGTWHLEDSAFKAKYIRKMMQRHDLQPKTVCEIGCGAGGILDQLQATCGPGPNFVGYEISPQAHELSQQFARPGLQFVLGDAFSQSDVYDLVLVMDVVEHVEDCFGFLRQTREKGKYKLYHFPLEITCTTALRDILGRAYSVGHIHHFSMSTALAALEYTGHRVVDWLWTPVGLECAKLKRTRMMNGLRRLLPTSLAARLVGGYSLMILAE